MKEYYSAVKRNELLICVTTWALKTCLLSKPRTDGQNTIWFHLKKIPRISTFIETEGGIDIFNQTLVKGIRKFVDEHRKMDIALGEIKPRYSKTVNDSYMSFGCKYCDSLFGNFFINDTFMDVIYSARSLPKALVEIDEDMIVNANCWYKLKI